jgi:hypothetical protein
MFVFTCIFALPIIVSGFILMAAVLNGGQGSFARAFSPDSYWRILLSDKPDPRYRLSDISRIEQVA